MFLHISSFLADRLARIKVNGYINDWIKSLFGTSAGTSLGPLLFIMYIHHVPKTIFPKFADDLVSVSVDNDVSQITRELQLALSPPRKLRRCAAQLLRNFRVFLQARNFCHGAQLSRNFGSFWAVFCSFLPFWRHFGAKGNMEPLSTHNLYEICSCLSENCDFLTPYFFTVNATGLEWLD